jgi:hypothetical protein
MESPDETNRIGCTIALVSTGPQLIRPQAAQERNWLPMVVAAVILVAVAIGLVLFYEHGKSAPAVTPISAALDPYAGNLSISNLHMSESANLAGGKVTYLDGSIANTGSRTVSEITVQVFVPRSGARGGAERNRGAEPDSYARALCGCRACIGSTAEVGRQRRFPADESAEGGVLGPHQSLCPQEVGEEADRSDQRPSERTG